MTVVEPPVTVGRGPLTASEPDPLPGPARSARRRTIRVLALIGCLVALLGLYLFAVHTEVGQRIDDAPILRYHSQRTTDADISFSTRTLDLATLALGPLVLWFGRGQRRRLVVSAFAVAVALGLAELSRHVLARPNFGHEDPLYGASFPSGHAAAAMALALALVLLVEDRRVWRFVVSAVPTFVVALALATPIHRPSDLTAGVVLALATMIGAQWFSRVADRPSASQWRQRRVRWRFALVRAVGLSAVFLVVEQLVLRRAHLTLADLGWTFPVALLAVVVVSELTVVAFRVALARL